jgi:hypothetical protein
MRLRKIALRTPLLNHEFIQSIELKVEFRDINENFRCRFKPPVSHFQGDFHVFLQWLHQHDFVTPHRFINPEEVRVVIASEVLGGKVVNVFIGVTCRKCFEDMQNFLVTQFSAA